MSSIGRQFEDLFSKKYSVSKQPNSGATPFYKMDAEGKRLLYSLKATQKKSFRVTEDDLKEVSEAVRGIGGLSADHIPALSFSLVKGDKPRPSDPTYVVLEMGDLVSLVQEKAEVFQLDKNEKKRQLSKLPELFRKTE